MVGLKRDCCLSVSVCCYGPMKIGAEPVARSPNMVASKKRHIEHTITDYN